MANLAQDFARFYLTIRPYLIFALVPSVGGQIQAVTWGSHPGAWQSSGDISPKSGLARYTIPPAVVRPRARPECGPPGSGGASEGACSLEGGAGRFPPPFFVAQLRLSV